MAEITSKDKLVAVKAFARANPYPLDVSTVFDSLSAATSYVTNDPTSYDLQIIGVNNGGKPECYIVYSKQLFPVGGSSQTQVVSSEEEMLALEDIKVGTMVFRSDNGRFYILVAEDASNNENWKTETQTELQWGSF